MIVFTSNTTLNLEEGFRSRCITVNWPMPNEENRREIIQFYGRQKGVLLTDEFVGKMAKKYTEFSGRDISNAFGLALKKARKERVFLTEEQIQEGFEIMQASLNANKETWGKWIKDRAYEAKDVIVGLGAVATVVAIVLGGKKAKSSEDKESSNQNAQSNSDSTAGKIA